MASHQRVSKAQSLLDQAAALEWSRATRLKRHLLTAAALHEVLTHAPVVVGGTAEEYWTAAEYLETDLDMCTWLADDDVHTMEDLGFQREGRHWYHSGARVAVEFPSSIMEGEESRIRTVAVGRGTVRLIGLEDLYLDRLKQATAKPDKEEREFNSALAVAGARYEEIDWTYVRARIAEEHPFLGEPMRRLDRKIRRRVRASLTS